jgi:hypothetical protein
MPGGGEGNRTPGLNSAIVALCQLSYTPEGAGEVSGSPRRRPPGYAADRYRQAALCNAADRRTRTNRAT